jgi:ketosteroid isomerase-like protein
MSENNKQIARRAYQALSEGIRSGDLSRLEEVVDRNVRDHNADPNQKQGSRT